MPCSITQLPGQSDPVGPNNEPERRAGKTLNWLWDLSTNTTNDPGDMIPEEKRKGKEKDCNCAGSLHSTYIYTAEVADRYT